MQLWQPYMISLVEVTLGIDNYILPIGIVVLASAVLSVLAGKAMDRFGKEKFYYPVAAMQVLGGLIAYSIKFLGHAMPLLCVGGTCIMAGNLAMAGLFTASSRDYTPAGRAGASQSVKMVIYIMLPWYLRASSTRSSSGPSRSSRRRPSSPNTRATPAATSTRMSCFWPRT